MIVSLVRAMTLPAVTILPVVWHAWPVEQLARIPPNQPCETKSVAPTNRTGDDCPMLRGGFGSEGANDVSVSGRVTLVPAASWILTLTGICWWVARRSIAFALAVSWK